HIQKNIESKESQIVEMEATIDILNNLIQSQKTHKAVSHSQFKNQFNAINQEKTEETKRLSKIIHDLEATQTEQKIKAEELQTNIAKLQEQLEKNNLAVLDKELEVDFLSEDLKTREAKLSKQNKNLSLAVETERLSFNYLQKE